MTSNPAEVAGLDAVPAPTDAGQLFVLDDEGVFFSRTRGELGVFNTAATFLWCSIEAGLPLGRLVDAYARFANVPAQAAASQVFESLREWSALGDIECPALPVPSAADVDTVLDWLTVNARLRARHRASPRELAAALGLDSDAAAAVANLDPDALDRQSALLEAARRPRQPAVAYDVPQGIVAADGTWITLPTLVARSRLAQRDKPPEFRCYQMLSTSFLVRYDDAATALQVGEPLAHLVADVPGACDVNFEVIGTDPGHVVVENLSPVAFCTSVDRVTPVLKSLFRLRALARHDFLMEIHAGVVATEGQCLLLPGPPGSGKSTLTAGLCKTGFLYFSDEVALIEDDLHLRPVPLGVGIKPGAVSALSEVWPAVTELAVHDREDGQRVRYLTLPQTRCAPPGARMPARWIVFPRYDAEAATELRPISRPEALRRLMRECMVLPKGLTEHQVERLVRWMRQTDCYELPMSSLPHAVALVRQMCAWPPPGP